MNESSALLKIIGYSFGAAVAALLVALFIGMSVFGFQFTQWAEWQGRIVGVVVTIAGVVGAAVGLLIVFRAER